MCPYQLMGFRLTGGSRRGSNLHQNLPWTGGDVRAKISSRLVQGLGFPLALHIPTD